MIEFTVHRADRAIWSLFAPHHYMSDNYAGHEAFVALLNDETLVGFTSYTTMPGFKPPQPVKREHRTVVLPDYQGMGLGVRLSEWLGEYLLDSGYRFYSKTSHPRMGEYRNASPLWRGARMNAKEGYKMKDKVWKVKSTPAYSHEYIGNNVERYEWVMSQRREGK